ncbi:3-phosphoinositide-dependent protein kinase [Striga asiatica]|uniref:non-specific serine/threonine protein kinase n=1 Tax=Striga asiatica TaxID=4170 RepID=A0A5A7P7Y3_STRAF|nr:3-phosphoinositide-dependent protein kinase [Striga asiatica]
MLSLFLSGVSDCFTAIQWFSYALSIERWKLGNLRQNIMLVIVEEDNMEKEFDSKLRIEKDPSSNAGINNHPQRSKSFAFRAPQENFSIQDFELEKIYGVGSYSKVVRAKKKDTGNVYAMKIMDKKFITKENKTAYVKLERIVLDQLDHPGVVPLFFTFQDTFSLYMALESCDGGELFDQITRKGRLSEDEARFYAAEVVDALEYIHSMGLIHRDIKPENLLLTTDGHIKIADFGSVKPMQGSRITVLPNAASGMTCGRLDDIDPSRRPGAGPGGYASLKNHPFFKGIDWTNLREGTVPPKLALESRAQLTGGQEQGSFSATRTNDDGNASASEAGSITRLASIDSFDSKWKQFLEPGESVLMISNVKKLQKLTNKKVQLILTNKPKLIYVDPAKLVVKGNIIWSDNPNDLSIQVTSPSNFKICTPKKVMSFEDAKQRAMQWKKAIETLQSR